MADNLVLNNGTADETFAVDKYEINKTTYNGPDHTIGDRDKVELYRTFPKSNGNSRGMKKSAIKLTLDVQVTNESGDGNITLPCICEISSSIPVGTDPAITALIRARAQSALGAEFAASLQDELKIINDA